ncbi:MAG: hypothetical protein C4583_05580 [Anaerolineaceae bacterium]|nr:MAG: hypothetical protein C4583_05580 [Anaerolineaceae bacterium]
MSFFLLMISNAFTGADRFTASGVPDFRSPETGLWARAEALQEGGFEMGTLQGFYRALRYA